MSNVFYFSAIETEDGVPAYLREDTVYGSNKTVFYFYQTVFTPGYTEIIFDSPETGPLPTRSGGNGRKYFVKSVSFRGKLSISANRSNYPISKYHALFYFYLSDDVPRGKNVHTGANLRDYKLPKLTVVSDAAIYHSPNRVLYSCVKPVKKRYALQQTIHGYPTASYNVYDIPFDISFSKHFSVDFNQALRFACLVFSDVNFTGDYIFFDIQGSGSVRFNV